MDNYLFVGLCVLGGIRETGVSYTTILVVEPSFTFFVVLSLPIGCVHMEIQWEQGICSAHFCISSAWNIPDMWWLLSNFWLNEQLN